MLLEETTLDRRLAEILATTMPGHGGDSPAQEEREQDGDDDGEDDKGQEQPS
jgi:hypothetical protein